MSKLSDTADKTVLIASSSLDEAVWMPVAQNLGQRGYDVVVYEADKVADGRIALGISIGQEGGMQVSYGGKPFDLDSVSAAWYRRPNMFAEEQVDKACQLGLDTERKMIQYSLWDTVPEQAWLNAPKRILHAGHKLTQLAVAREVGFDIPGTTIVSNDWDRITKLPPKIIFKPSYSRLYADNKLKEIHTELFDNTPSALPLDNMPFPGFWQPYLHKAREWRITVVGDRVFDAAVYTDASAKDDWRKHQHKTAVQFKQEPFPDEQKDMCLKYLDRLGLKFGAFDFIEDNDGKITFLECNENGQFGWLEDELGLPISSAIADELSKIAQATNG